MVHERTRLAYCPEDEAEEVERPPPRLFVFPILASVAVLVFVAVINIPDSTGKGSKSLLGGTLKRSSAHEEHGKHAPKHGYMSTNMDLLQCEDGTYSKRTLKLAHEMPFAALFSERLGQTKFEASDVIIDGDFAHAVCDSSWSISKFEKTLPAFGSNNVQIGLPDREPGEDSGYEALVRDGETMYFVRASIQHQDSSYRAIIEQVNVQNTANNYDVIAAVSTEFEFEGGSKGFEGMISLRDLNNELVLLGLCEGNHCSEKSKHDVGNGKVVAMKLLANETTSIWHTLRMIDIPHSAAFRDYSAIALRGNRVAITSQEDSQVWIGYLKGQEENGLWDTDRVEFQDDGFQVYNFPKDHDCHTVYCNIEGIHFIDDNTLMAVSDKMKGNGKQDFRCFDKDQSAHIFVIP